MGMVLSQLHVFLAVAPVEVNVEPGSDLPTVLVGIGGVVLGGFITAGFQWWREHVNARRSRRGALLLVISELTASERLHSGIIAMAGTHGENGVLGTPPHDSGLPAPTAEAWSAQQGALAGVGDDLFQEVAHAYTNSRLIWAISEQNGVWDTENLEHSRDLIHGARTKLEAFRDADISWREQRRSEPDSPATETAL